MLLLIKLSRKVTHFLSVVSRSGITPNGQVFMKKGKFGTRPPVTGAGFCTNFELLPTAS
jgi:hypothetical protein